jgi:hypothetical protein
MEIIDVFNQSAFGVISLSNMVTDMAPQFGYLDSLNVFPDEGVTQRTVAVDIDTTNMQLVPSTAWGGAPVANKTATGKTLSFAIPHFPIEDQILASDLQGRRRPGSDVTVDMQFFLAKKMREIRRKLEQTREWMRLGILKSGLVKDGAGNTVLDLYGAFGISQVVTSLVLGTTTTNVLQLISAVKRNTVLALRGSPMTYMTALCSDGFYDALTSHPNVVKAFQYFQNGNGYNLAMDLSFGATKPSSEGLFTPPTNVFLYGGVAWINYSGTLPDASGTAQPLIDVNSAYLFPMGTDVFKTWYAPANYMETVNTEGMPFYAKQVPTKYDKGLDIECQMNPLPICLKPAVIQKLTT